MPPRAGDVSICSDKLAAALGEVCLAPWPASDRFLPDGPAWHFHRPAGESGSPELLAKVLYNNPLLDDSLTNN
jgi:dTDP-4-dehydrorhamnose reductase